MTPKYEKVPNLVPYKPIKVKLRRNRILNDDI